jgi:hypothetical protein
MATTQAEYFQEHAASGDLTDAQMAELLSLPEGDTTTLMVESGKPDPAPVAAPAEPQSTSTSTTTQDPANPVVLAKDGVHTIPYEKLVEARDGEKHWKAQAEAAQQQLAALQAQADQRAAAGQAPTTADAAVAQAAAAIEAGVDPDLFGDFSEEAIAKGVQKLVDARVAAIEAKFAEVVKPLQAKAQVTEAEKHFQAIYQAHPDADSLAESAELKAWINTQPSFVRHGFEAVLSQGTTTQVIELLDAFKAANGRTQTPPAAQNAAEAAKAVIAKAQTPVPASLSDIPGSAAGPADELEAMRQMSATDLMGKLEGKTPDQIEALMARLL